jgi:hypothetical protein
MAFRRSPVRSWSAPPINTLLKFRYEFQRSCDAAGSNWRPPGGFGGRQRPPLNGARLWPARSTSGPVRSWSAPPPSLPLGRDLRLRRTGTRLGRLRPRPRAWSLARSRSRSARLLPSGRLLALRPELIQLDHACVFEGLSLPKPLEPVGQFRAAFSFVCELRDEQRERLGVAGDP